MVSLTNLGTLLIVATTALATSAPAFDIPGSRDNSEECDCYLVSGPDPGYFQYYRFWDFRNILSEGDEDFAEPPALITPSEDSGGQNVTSAYFNSNYWNNDWSILNQPEEPNASVPSVNSAQNVFISQEQDEDGDDFTYLTLRASRPSEEFVSIAEVDSNQNNILYSSIRTRMRIIPLLQNATNAYGAEANNEQIPGVNDSHPVAPGACFGFFTFLSNTQESDLEILTYDPITDVRYSNQPDYDAETDSPVPGASTQVSMPDNTVWTDWHDHRIDWYNGISRWYVDNQLMLEKTLNVPTEPSSLILNLWSNGGNWTGNMSVDAQVTAGLQWIEMTFNISGVTKDSRSILDKRKQQKSCSIGCNVDGVWDTGHAIVAFNVTGSGSNANSAERGVHFISALTQVVFIIWVTMLMV